MHVKREELNGVGADMGGVSGRGSGDLGGGIVGDEGGQVVLDGLVLVEGR